MKSDEEVFQEQGFFHIHKCDDGTYRAQNNITTYFGLYIQNGVVKIKSTNEGKNNLEAAKAFIAKKDVEGTAPGHKNESWSDDPEDLAKALVEYASQFEIRK